MDRIEFRPTDLGADLSQSKNRVFGLGLFCSTSTEGRQVNRTQRLALANIFVQVACMIIGYLCKVYSALVFGAQCGAIVYMIKDLESPIESAKEEKDG